MTYANGWSEVWFQIEGFVSKAYQGHGEQARHIQMFLDQENNGTLVETYFDWSMTPLRGQNGVKGIWIPNFEVTGSVIANRRMNVLAQLQIATADSESYASFWKSAHLALSNPSNLDCPALAIYSSRRLDDESLSDDREGSRDNWTDNQRARFDRLRRRKSSEGTTPHELYLVSPHKGLPENLSMKASQSPAREILRNGFLSLCEESHVLFDADQSRQLWGDRLGEWDDAPKQSIMIPIKNSSRTDGVLIVALNTRRPLDTEYLRFLNLLGSTISSGLAIIKLFAVKLQDAQYAQWIAEQQKLEMKQALELRTKELLLVEGQFTRVAALLPCGLWVANASGQLVYVNDAWWKITGHPRDKPVNDFSMSVVDEDRPECINVFSTLFSSPRDRPDAEEFLRNLNSKGGHVFRWKGTNEDGLPRYCSNLSSRDLDEDGNVTSVVGIITDFSRQKHEEFLQTQRTDDALHRKMRLNRFVDLLSHELR